MTWLQAITANPRYGSKVFVCCFPMLMVSPLHENEEAEATMTSYPEPSEPSRALSIRILR